MSASAALIPGALTGPAASPANAIASFAATLAQFAPASASNMTLTGAGDGLFVGELGMAGSAPGADQALAGLSSAMALVARLASNSTSAGSVTTSPSVTQAPQAHSVTGTVASVPGVTGADIVATAMDYRGTPYVWGGTTPSGFDCSGLTQYVYARWGIAIPRTSEEQATIGAPVASLANAQPGDLLFFAGSDGTASSPGHVGIYVGNGEMIDSPYLGTTVQVQPLATAGPVVAIRRVLGSVS